MTDKLFYDERQAIEILRKSIAKGRIHVLDALYKDLSKETIGHAMVRAKNELAFNLQAVQALQSAVAMLMEPKP